MGSGFLYVVIVGIWALVLLPMWLKKHDTDAGIRNVDNFRAAMATLSDGLLMPSQTKPTVTAKRAVPSGLDVIKRNSFARRRRAFLATLSTVPTTVLGVVLGSLSLVALALPVVAFAGYVMWVRHDMNVVAMQRRASARGGRIDEDILMPVASSRTNARQRSQLARAMATIRRAATARLLQEEPVIDTAATESWQPAEVEVTPSTFAVPDHFVPTYVTAPAATSVPRELDRKYGTWDGDAMLAAASQQQRLQAEHAAMVAQVEQDKRDREAIKAADDDERTERIARIVGA